MSLELAANPRLVHSSPQRIRRAAVHVADRIAAEHPHLDARQLAADPAIAAEVRELLAALGLTPTTTTTPRGN